MIDLELIRSIIVTGLTAHMNMPVIETDAEEMPAAYPFIQYGFTGPVRFSDKPPSLTVIPSSTEGEVVEEHSIVSQTLPSAAFNETSLKRAYWP